MDSGRGDKARARAVLYLAFFWELYEIQVHGVRYFLHTHSNSADSWEESTAVDFMDKLPDTFLKVTDRSLFGPNFESCSVLRVRKTFSESRSLFSFPSLT